MKWKRRFYRFLKKEGAYAAYIENVKEYWADHIPHNIYQAGPTGYIDSTFGWGQTPQNAMCWDTINKKWLKALRRDRRVKQFSGYKLTQMPTLRFSSKSPNRSQIPKHEGIDFSGLFPSVSDISKIVDAANIRIVIGTGCGPSSVSSLCKSAEALWERSSPEKIIADLEDFMKDMNNIMHPITGSISCDISKIEYITRPAGAKELEAIAGAASAKKEADRKIPDFNVKGNQPVWFSKKRRN